MAQITHKETENTTAFEDSPTPNHQQRSVINQALKELQANKHTWWAIELPERIVILDEIISDMQGLADRWVSAILKAKNLPKNSFPAGEEWMTLGLILRQIRLIRQTLHEIHKTGSPRPLRARRKSNGQVTVDVFPLTIYEHILHTGVRAELRMQKGSSIEDIRRTQAQCYRTNPPCNGKVSLVLGAGNNAAVPISDILHELFTERQVVLLKMNPVNDYLAPLIEEGFGVLLRRGFLRLIQGDAETGTYLCQHPDIEEIHLTGSDKTFETIVFGSGTEGKRRKSAGNPLLDKPITGELGNITPIIVVPGPWTNADLKRMASLVTSSISSNAGCNCMTPRVIIQHAGWELRESFLRAIGETFSNIPPQKAYYPGAVDRYLQFIESHNGKTEFYGKPREGQLPWTIFEDLDPAQKDDLCFTTEPFCSIASETALEAPDTETFLARAVDFANQTLWGSLCAMVLVHPKTLRDPKNRQAFDLAIDNLRYGTVAINIRLAYTYFAMSTAWGAFPGHKITDIQSGIGKCNNALMFEHIEKTVMWAPFNRLLDPFQVNHTRMDTLGRNMAFFEAAPSIGKLPSLIRDALLG